MKQFFLKHRKWILYTLYGVLLTPVLMFFLFPSEALREYIQAGIQGRYPSLLVKLNKVSLSFPPGLKLAGIECRTQGASEQTIFMADKIIIRPGFRFLFSKSQEYLFTCHAYDGTITGYINIIRNGQDEIFSLSTELDNIHINEKSPLPFFIKDYMEGVLAGTIAYSGADLSDPKATGEAVLTLSDGSFKLSKPFLKINVIDFKEALLKSELKDQSMNIPELSLKGDDFFGQASGVINLVYPMDKSRISFKGTFEPTATFMQDSGTSGGAGLLLKQSLKNGKLPFVINGTVEKPVFGLQ